MDVIHRLKLGSEQLALLWEQGASRSLPVGADNMRPYIFNFQFSILNCHYLSQTSIWTGVGL